MKKIVLNVPQEISRDDAGMVTVGGFGSLEPVREPVEIVISTDLTGDQPNKVLSEQELKENKLSQNGVECLHTRCTHVYLSFAELSSHPAFRNYSQGDPTSRLYIKNLAKNVTEEVTLWTLPCSGAIVMLVWCYRT